LASGEVVVTSSPDSALLSLSQESSDDLGTLVEESSFGSESPWSDASDPLLAW